MDKIVLVHLVTVVYNAGGATSRIGAKQSSFKVISTVKNSCSFCWQRDMDKIVLVHLVTVVYNAGGATSRIGAKQSSFKVISTVKNSCSFQQQHEPPATAKLPAPKVTLVTAAVAA